MASEAESTAEPKDDKYDEIQNTVKEIVELTDTYFQSHPDATVQDKNNHIQKKIEKVLESIRECEGTVEDNLDKQRKLEYLKAQILNLSEIYNAEAEQILTKYVKFFPKNHEAWNMLGEIYWKKKDMEMAKICFEGSQKHAKNVEGMVNLSLLLRNLRCKNGKECMANIKLSIERAREAITMDPKYGRAWYTLANGYLNLYFESSQEPKYLKQALKAYHKASEDYRVHLMPEFHFNKGMAHKCERNFHQALICLENASQRDPTWEKAGDHYNGLLVFMNNIITSLKTKGGMKPRKFEQFVSSQNKLNSNVYLGPYSPESEERPLTPVKLKTLKSGKNEGVAILGKVICQVFDPEPMSFTFCIVDSEGTTFIVTVYNISGGKGVIIGDMVALPEPVVDDFEFEFKEKSYKFSWIRACDPMPLVINGRSVPPTWRASLESVSIFRPG